MSRRPTRETIAFAVALAAVAIVGGVAAASVASATPTAPPNATVDYDGERLNVDPAPDQTISGTTTLPAGEQVTIRVRSTDGEQPFLRQAVANVSGDGTFATTMDFGDVERGVEFTVSVRHNGTKLATAPAVVGECDPSCGDAAGSATLETGVVAVTEGETAEVSLSLENRDTATLVVDGGESVTLPVTVTDGNGDGTVVVELETAVDAQSEYGASAKATGDAIRVHEDATRPLELDAAEYDLSLYASDSPDGMEPDDVGQLVVNEGTDDPGTTRGTDETTVGTIYESASTDLDESTSGLSLEVIGLLVGGGVLAVLGIVALVGGLD